MTEVRQAEGMDATDLDYTDDDYTLLETGWHGVKRGPTVSERARVLSKLDTHVPIHTYIYICVWCGGSGASSSYLAST